jgi:hypothetical protein
MLDRVEIELRFWEGCPSHTVALAQLRDVLTAVGQDPDAVTTREVMTDEEAAELGFIGSPTIIIDGDDLFETAGQAPALTCRVYRLRDGRFSPTPDLEDLHELLAARL